MAPAQPTVGRPRIVPGEFSVDGQRIDSGRCRQIAPENSDRFGNGVYSFVNKQPTSEIEWQDCRRAGDD